MSSSRTYFVAARTSTPAPASARISSRFERMLSTSRSVTGSTIDPDEPGLAARALAISPVRVEDVGIAIRTEIRGLDPTDTRAAQQRTGDGRQIEHPALGDAVQV